MSNYQKIFSSKIFRLMSEISRYNFKLIEEKWQTYWQKNKSFKVEINKQKNSIV